MKKFLQQNPLLAAGVMLPVALIVFLWLAQTLPQWGVEPPQYRVVFATTKYTDTRPKLISYKLDTKDGQVSLWIWPRWTRQGHYIDDNQQALFVFDPVDGTTEELDLQETLASVPKDYFSCLTPEQRAAITRSEVARLSMEACKNSQQLREAYGNEYLTLPIVALAGKNFSAGQIAPDGYRILSEGDGGEGILSDLFYRPSYFGKINIGKNGRKFQINARNITDGTIDFYRLRVLGWLPRE